MNTDVQENITYSKQIKSANSRNKKDQLRGINKKSKQKSPTNKTQNENKDPSTNF